MEVSGQQCYAPVLLPVMYAVPFEQLPAFSLPPPQDDSSECSRSVTESSDDVSAQLECAIAHGKCWTEIEGNLFVRVFPMPLLSQCFVEDDAGEFRAWGTNTDIDTLFQILGYKFLSIAVVRTSTMNVTDLTPNGERKIMHIQHGLRLIRAFPDSLSKTRVAHNFVT